MSRFVLLFLKLHIIVAFPWQAEKIKPPEVVSGVSATLLRGVQAADTGAKAKAAVKTSRVESGVELYGKECVDCIYNSAQCGCGPAMEYLACLTKHCYKSDEQKFVKMCSVLQGHCFSELDIECRGPDTVCDSKFSQTPAGGLGLTWDPTALFDNAFCGPFGKCIGDIHMHVTIHNRPVGVKKPLTPCDKLKDKKPVEIGGAPIWLECGIPLTAKANIDKREDWIICSSEVKDDRADCKVPMAATLQAQQVLESYCVLTDGKDLKRLTQPVWRNIKNKHVGEPEPLQPANLDDEQTAVSMDHAAEAIDASHGASANAADTMNEAAKEKPPYMEDSDSPRKLPPGRQLAKEANYVKRGGEDAAQTVHKASHEQNEKVRGGVAQAANEAAEAREPIVKEVRDLKKGAKASRVEVAADVSQATNEAAYKAEKVSDASSEAAQKVKQAAEAKPPYMKDSDAEDKTPLSSRYEGIKSIVNNVVQSPVMREFA